MRGERGRGGREWREGSGGRGEREREREREREGVEGGGERGGVLSSFHYFVVVVVGIL